MPYSTLRKHVEHILAKLDLHSSRQAVLWAERHGMLSREER
jgi:DNA-binding CsgD family transcriptional regulator